MIDMLALLELARNLGGRADRSDRYDELVMHPDHVKRLSVLAPAASLFGTKISSDLAVPDGIAIMRQGGKVIGAIDFHEKRTLFINNPTEWFEISEKSQ